MSELMNSTPLVPQLQTMLVASATLATEVKRLFGSPSMMGTPVCQVLLRLAFWCAVKSWDQPRSEEHTSELQSRMRISYAVSCLKKKKEKAADFTRLTVTDQT